MEQKTIMIADDEVEVLNILEKKLRQNNYSVVAVSTGKEVIDLCKVKKPDLILLDIVMPDMDGYTVTVSLKKEKALKNIPIVYITGKDLAQSGIQKRINELDAYDFITKPCAFEDILSKIKEVLG